MDMQNYCLPDEVRAVLGVSDEELPNETLALGIYQIGLQESLLKVSPTLQSKFDAIRALSESARTGIQQKLHNRVRLFSTYAVARQAGLALGMLGPKALSDEKSSFSRFAGEPYKDVLGRIETELGKATTDVKEALAELDNEALSAHRGVGLVVVSRRYDPVTGETLGGSVR